MIKKNRPRHRAQRGLPKGLIALAALAVAVALVVVFVFSGGEATQQKDSKEEAQGELLVEKTLDELPLEEPRLGNTTDLVKGNPTDKSGDWLVIDKLGIEAPLDSVGTVAAGSRPEMIIPEDVSRVGWLNTTAEPDWTVGSSIISGHVSDRSDRPGALWRLKEVQPGDLIKWVQDGKEWTYIVESLSSYDRQSELPDSMFSGSGDKALYVVTCYDRQDLGGGHFTYRKNLVVKTRLYGVIDDPIEQ